MCVDLLGKLDENAGCHHVFEARPDGGQRTFDIGQRLQRLFRKVFRDHFRAGIAAGGVRHKDKVIDGNEARIAAYIFEFGAGLDFDDVGHVSVLPSGVRSGLEWRPEFPVIRQRSVGTSHRYSLTPMPLSIALR